MKEEFNLISAELLITELEEDQEIFVAFVSLPQEPETENIRLSELLKEFEDVFADELPFRITSTERG